MLLLPWLHNSEEWEHTPVVAAQAPDDIDDSREFVAKTRLMFDVMKLAIKTYSTRLISLFVDSTVIHNITHHGGRPEAIAELRAKEEEDETLLDGSMVLYGTPMSSANSHSNVNLPVLLAGGGFKYGQYLNSDNENIYPLASTLDGGRIPMDRRKGHCPPWCECGDAVPG